MTTPTGDKRLRLRRDDSCRVCAVRLVAGSEAWWERGTRSVRCTTCPADEVQPPSMAVPDAPVDVGTAGASARREHERRRARDEQRMRDKHPRIGGLVLALQGERRSTRSWAVGAVGEERFGAGLDARVSDRLKVLHDRRIPGTRANIDHLVVTPSGVWVVDPKRYSGRPALRVEGGVLRPRVEKLVVAGRDRTRLVDGVLKQVALVAAVIEGDIPVHGVLCFIDADWPLIGGSFVIRDVDVLWPRRLYPRLAAAGPLDAAAIDGLPRRLAAACPGA